MNLLAVIPARGGSKRLPGKNIRSLGGRPLIAWSIDAARESGCCTDVIVSTDDRQIAAIAAAYGASVPWLRPSALASDTATSVDTALHALDETASTVSADGLLLLQPTSPFRSARSIQAAMALFSEYGGARPVVGISPAPSHPAWTFRARGTGMEPYLGWEPLQARSQDLEPAWVVNGAIYVVAPQYLREHRAFLTPDAVFLRMEDPREAIDIDSEQDWVLAKYYAESFATIGRPSC